MSSGNILSKFGHFVGELAWALGIRARQGQVGQSVTNLAWGFGIPAKTAADMRLPPIMMIKPSAPVLSNTIKVLTLKPHTPLIRFRKQGGGVASSEGASHGGSGGVSNSPVLVTPAPGQQLHAQPGPNGVFTYPPIEDFQLPAKYQRRPLSQAEIDYINRGGPE